MKKIIISLAFCATGFAAVNPVSAQGHEELLRFSQYDWSYGTARSAAMGGAFASLGADLSSMAVNPAGLGMYRRSEIGFSPSYTSLTTRNSQLDDLGGGRFEARSNRGRMAMGNLGAAFNVHNGSGVVTSVTFGFAYNKLIDHNASLNNRGRSGVSMADMFALQLTDNRIDPDPGVVSGYLDNGDYAGILGALMAYESGLVEYDDARGIYHLDNTLAEGSYLDSNLRKQSVGSTGQYDISLGMNLGNTLYLGASFGIQNLYYKETTDYRETARDNFTDPGYLDNFNQTTFVEQRGDAWNVKFGAILRPVEALRIGVAFHTPTYVTTDEKYYADMYTQLYDLQSGESHSTEFRSTYRLRTPMRLIAGVSYTLFDRAILSLDYERVWYDKMKMFWDDWGDEVYEVTGEVESTYKAAENLRAGLEVNVAPNWFVRGGFAFYGGMYRDEVLFLDEPDFKNYKGQTMNYSGGFGYRTAGWGIDLAYVYMDRKEAPGRAFDYGPFYTSAWRNDLLRHNVTATLSLRF